VTSDSPGSAQATNYWYDADGNQVALEDPDQNATLWTYNGMDQTTESIQGQMESGSSPWSFNQLTPVNGQQQTFEVYVHFSAAPGSGWQNYSVTDAYGTLSFTPKSGVTATVGGWYDLGTVTLAAGDSSTSVTLTDNSSTLPDEVSLAYNYGDYPSR
jgi:YD repeat-containing protein